MAPYVPRAAADTVLHGVVREHLETFLAAAAARTDGVGLPRFIEREFRAFLRCGLLVHVIQGIGDCLTRRPSIREGARE